MNDKRYFSLNIEKRHELALRLLVLLIFTALLYGVEYRRVQNDGFTFDENTRSRLMGTIRGANGGYPFYFYLGDNIDPGDIDPNYAYQWSNTADDYGVHILTASISVIGRQLDDDFQVDTTTPFKALFGLFFLTSVIFLWPSVPFPLSLGGMSALSIGIFLGPIALRTSSQNWGVTYMAILAGMVFVTASYPKSRLHLFFVIFLSGLIGFSQFLRQESVGVAYATGLGLLLVIWFMTAIAYGVQRQNLLPLAKNVSISALGLLLGVFLAPFVLRGIYAQAWETPYSETKVTQHGAGLPLYVGTGYVSNPYNIAWLDPIGEIHAQLYRPGVSIQHGNHEFQATLQSAWREIVLESPWLVLENVAAKTQFLHQFLANGETPYPSAFLYAEQSDAMRLFYFAAILVFIGAGGGVVYHQRLDGLFLVTTLAFLILGSCVGPLSGFPSYIAGPQGATLVIVCLLPAALYTKNPLWQGFSERLIFKRVLGVGLGFIGLGVLVGVMVMAVQWQRFQGRLGNLQDSDPFAEIQSQEFRYGHYFNTLSMDEQENILKKLTTHEQILLPVETSDSFFQPHVALVSKNQLHVIVWMGEDYPEPVRYINQARVYSLIQICLACDNLAQTYNYTHDAVVYTFLNDSDWKNAYRFLSFPIDSAVFEDAETLLIGVQQMVDWGGTATGFSYQVNDIDSQILKVP